MHIALLRHSIKNPWSPYFRGELALSCPQLQAEHRRLRRPVSLVGFIAHGWTPKFSTSRSLLSIEDPPESWPSLSGEYCCARSNAESNIPLLFQRAQRALALFSTSAERAAPALQPGYANLLKLISLNNIHRNLCYVLPMNFHCRRFLYPSYNTCRQMSTYSVHVQYVYTLNSSVLYMYMHIVYSVPVHRGVYATRLGTRLSKRAESSKRRSAKNSHNEVWPFLFQNRGFWSP